MPLKKSSVKLSEQGKQEVEAYVTSEQTRIDQEFQADNKKFC
ncbi:hypothetical protein OLM08_03695 [Enterococcus faecalis]|nr:hypothetical protein OLM08_03695 [Enterococcus faecalis]